MPKLWTVKDCAAAWGLSEGRVCALLRAGRVPDARQRIIRGHVEWQVPEGTPKAVFYGIDSDKNNKPDQIKGYAKDAGVTYTILKDDGNQYADAVHAKQTPEVFILDKAGKLAYHGAVDDRKDPKADGANNFVRAALDEILADKPVTKTEVPQWGCGIKRMDKAQKEG